MKWKKSAARGKWFLWLTLSLLVLPIGALPANAGGTGTFEVGGYWQPAIYIGQDYNTNASWANVAAASIDMLTGVRVPAGINLDKAHNETGIAGSNANNVKLLVVDSGISGIPVYSASDISNLQARLNPYVSDSRVKGINIVDEPWGYQMEGFANTYKVVKAAKPSWETYFNLNPIYGNGDQIYAPPGKLAVSNSAARGSGSGSFLTASHSLGQTITIPAGMTYLDGVDFYIDPHTWSTGETIILRLWNGPSKTTLYSEAIVPGDGKVDPWNYTRYLQLSKTVTPGSTYYLEMTHGGGGDGSNSIGWVVHSNSDTYSGGVAYENGAAQTYDFAFRLYTSRTNVGSLYENYVDDWLEYSGADSIMYDNYAFQGPNDTASYFQNLEMVRGRGLARDVVYGAFLQNVNLGSPLRIPSLDMMRWNVYTTLIYGYKNLNWFTYWQPDPCPDWSGSMVDCAGNNLTKYAYAQTLNSEMRKLGGTLKDLTSVRVFHTGSAAPTPIAGTVSIPPNFFIKPADLTQPVIEGYFTNAAGRKYIMLTNRDYNNSRTLNFNFSPKPASLTEISKTTGLEVSVPGYNAATGVLNITLDKGEGRLFAMPAGFNPYDNLAAEATVTATSSYESTLDGWGIAKVNDDNSGSTSVNSYNSFGWSSHGNRGIDHTESVTFNLGAVKTVGEIELYPRNDSGNVGAGFPKNFNVQVANNAAGPWTTVLTQTNYPLPGAIGQYFPLSSPVNAQYVKIEGTSLRQITTESGSPYRMQLAEVEIRSMPNYAKGALVSSTSSVESVVDGWGQAKVTDRIRNSVAGATGWSSNSNLTAQSHTESVTFNLQSAKNISKVVLYPRTDNGNAGAGFPIDFTVQVANNAAGPWTTVVTQTGYTLPNRLPQTFTFAATTVQYVKVQGTKHSAIATEGGAYRMQLAEVEIY